MLTLHLPLSKLTIVLQKSSNGDQSMLLSSSVLQATFNLPIQSSSFGGRLIEDLRKDSEEERFLQESMNSTKDGNSEHLRRKNDPNLLQVTLEARKLLNEKSSPHNELLLEQISERFSRLRRTRIKASISTFQIKEQFDRFEGKTTMCDTRSSITTEPRQISATSLKANGERQEVNNNNDLDSAYNRTRVVLDQEPRRSTLSEPPQPPMPIRSKPLLKHLETRIASSILVPTPMRTNRRRSMLSTLPESTSTSPGLDLTNESNLQLRPPLFDRTLLQLRLLSPVLMEETSCKTH